MDASQGTSPESIWSPSDGVGNMDMMQLQNALARIMNSRSLDPGVLDPLASLINRRTPTSAGDSAGTANVTLAFTSLAALNQCSRRGLYRNNPALVAKVERMLADIWKWSRWTLSQGLIGGPLATLLPPGAPETILNILCRLCDIAQLRESFLRLSSFLATITYVWLNEGDWIREEHEVLLSYLLNLLLQPHELQNARIELLLREADGRHDLIARTALRPLRARLNDEKDLSNLRCRLSILMTLAHYDLDKNMSDAILVAGGMRTITTLLQHLHSLSAYLADRHASSLSNAFIGCCSILIDACENSSNPVQSVLQLIDHGVLQTILALPDLAQPSIGGQHSDYSRTVSAPLRRLFTPYMIYYSVSRAAIKQVARHPLPTVAEPLVNEACMAFFALVEQRRRNIEVFNAEYLQVCHSSECRKSSDAQRMKTCSGCAAPRYCSVRCQRADWPSHRKSCLAYQERRCTASELPMSLIDEEFVYLLSRKELCGRGRVIQARIRSELGSTPITDVLAELTWYVASPMLTFAEKPGDGERCEGEDTLAVSIAIPWGARLRLLPNTMFLSLEELS